MNNKSICLLLVVGALLPLASVHGDKLVEDELLDLYGSEEFISIATGYRQPIEKAPAVATILRADDIKRSGALDMDDILETVPGLHVARSFAGNNPIYTFRGIYSDYNPQVLMMIDGVPLSNLFSGNRSNLWGGIPIESIERIEIIRGPGSAIYGADAFAGVISVTTKDGSQIDGLETGVRYGTYATSDYYISYGHSWDDSSLGIFFEGYETNGQNEVINYDAQSLLDSLYFTNASYAPGELNLQRKRYDLRIKYKFQNLDLHASYQLGKDAGTGAGLVQALDDNGRFSGNRLRLGGNYNLEVNDSLSVNLAASYLKTAQIVKEDIQLYPAGSYGPFVDPATFMPLFPIFENGVLSNPEVFETHTRFDTTFRYTGFNRHDISLGVGYYYGDLYKTTEEKNYCTSPESCAYILPRLFIERLVDVSDTDYVFIRENDRENYHAYVQDVIEVANDWELTVGLRYDDYSDFGETVNPRLALVWSATRQLTAKLLYGEAFRAPAFVETLAVENPQSLGNPDLEPETMKSYEVAFAYKATNNLNLDLNLFYYKWEDIIQFVPDAGSITSTAQNAGEQTGYGFETEAKWSVNDFVELLVNFSYQESTNELTDKDVADAPQKQFYVQTNWEFMPQYHLNVQGNWVIGRERAFGDTRDDIDDYATIDLSLRRDKLRNGLEFALHVKNLFDENAREPSPDGSPMALIPNDLPMPGRRVVGEVRYNF